ncbi:MAG TPA: class I SAM-dependent methyltransferase [Cyclobacteriaceae bacterium]|nr:class I SAM-dependent methyltransferase [Cyclobacteriaceae bacterium]
MNFKAINTELGNADLFLVDLILKGFFKEGSVLLDAGCGEGRNLTYFLRNNFRVFGIDLNYTAIRMLRMAGRSRYPNLEPGNFIHGDILNHPFADRFFDYVLCFSVLHHARDESHFHRMIASLTGTLKIEGILVIGMNSELRTENEGIQTQNCSLPHEEAGQRLMLNPAILHSIRGKSDLALSEPVKTWIIDGQEAMSYLVLKKKIKLLEKLKKPTDE